ncbi:MAG: transposase, partial [Nitrospira bacterium HGW-Nitrospira-1]
MKRKEAKPVFKPYVMNQAALLPASYEELIPEKHLVRIVNEAVENIDLTPLVSKYKGGGTSSYHPKMLLKVLVYAYVEKTYASRRIAKALRENIHYMWISGGSRPDFRTLNNFRSSRMKEVIEDLFSAVVEYLMASGHVKLENYFVDGTKIEANANKHKVVWEKQRDRNHRKVKEQIKELLKRIDVENEAEQEKYGENQSMPKKKMRSISQAVKKLEGGCMERLEKYEEQAKILAGRNSYAKTDPEASCMPMKEDRGAKRPWPKPAYNVQMGTENQFIVGYSIHGRVGDTACLIPHLDQLRKQTKRLPQRIVADAGYGSEENYAYLQRHGVENYVKYNTFYHDTRVVRSLEKKRQLQFRADNFGYDPQHDEFICPANERLHFIGTVRDVAPNGYEIERRDYTADNCQQCELKKYCTRSETNRKIQISFQLIRYRRQARENLTSELGRELR